MPLMTLAYFDRTTSCLFINITATHIFMNETRMLLVCVCARINRPVMLLNAHTIRLILYCLVAANIPHRHILASNTIWFIFMNYIHIDKSLKTLDIFPHITVDGSHFVMQTKPDTQNILNHS